MLNRANQAQLLQELDTQLNVTDVYFWRGKLMIVNEYDAVAIDEFLDETGWAADVDFTVTNSEMDSLVAFG